MAVGVGAVVGVAVSTAVEVGGGVPAGPGTDLVAAVRAAVDWPQPTITAASRVARTTEIPLLIDTVYPLARIRARSRPHSLPGWAPGVHAQVGQNGPG